MRYISDVLCDKIYCENEVRGVSNHLWSKMKIEFRHHWTYSLFSMSVKNALLRHNMAFFERVWCTLDSLEQHRWRQGIDFTDKQLIELMNSL